ncbi:MAG: GlcNAc-PI de-N-acetylase [Acidimicrobiia bacterium]|nr:GlcNAc-PI de-N-acetylase [Acidimicrobiia bacterium]
MATLVAFHAHPDDESISMGGTMAIAAAAGHKVVVVTATDGAVGEVAEGFLNPGESLEDRRAVELQEAARILGIDRAVHLGYRDSGMMGTEDNEHPNCFWRADPDEAAAKLAAILEEEGADVLTVYDSHGGYGHPDHIQVHRVGHAAAKLAGVARVYEVTMNRDRIREMREMRPAEDGPDESDDRIDFDKIGLPESEITAAIDVSDLIATKRAAMAVHASQIDEDSWFLQLPPEVFVMSFGTEWFRQVTPVFAGDPVKDRQDWIVPEVTTK